MTARTLTLSDTESGLAISVGFDRWDGDRAQFAYDIVCGSQSLASGSDLRLVALDPPSEARALESLLSFLGAYAEAIAYESRTGSVSDNADLFPDSLRAAAETIGADGFWMLGESVREPEEA